MESGTEEQLLQLSLTGRLPPSLQKSFDEEKEKGNNAYREGRYHDAVQHYTAAESINPMSPIPPANRAMVFLKLKDFERAKAEASIAHELHISVPEEDRNKRLSAKILLRRATANKELMLYALAAEDYQAVLGLEDNATAKAELRVLQQRYGIRPPSPRLRSSLRNSASSEPRIEVVSETTARSNGMAVKTTQTSRPAVSKDQDDTELVQISKSTMQDLLVKWGTTEPRNAVDFERSWKSLRDDEMAQAKYLLEVVGAQRIEQGLLGEILTAQLLERVILVLSTALMREPGYKSSIALILLAFTKVSRFSMVLMFLTSAEKRKIRILIDTLRKNNVSEEMIDNLGERYL
ncbi:RNA polymerase II-associated protein 3 [Gracilariopsis chorda]|uniref:RNA polymerase II-associated protein 3 n=1 Tax=Gracilariopsis chorda TaxID=448386 RepID=A0A2V3INK9_9FLOR|nr:RNA polymerase II-associated protein 3 [Gracilariopsis chorda]|eukprot:PXF43671.1 RNA polymerase II-associated protein 3 [Gracilariopsis chorda]